MNTNKRMVLTEPEMLGRRDVEGGRWTIDPCNARRGEPRTSIIERKMLVPVDETEFSRCTRAHEMMHAKVSPANHLEEWAQRGIASQESMVAVEELRVNFLCQQVGFDMKKHFTDGSETADGERIAITGDWKNAVLAAIMTAGTASNKALLNGIRRHNRMWGNGLADISKRAVKEMKKASKYANFASTAVDQNSGLYPAGFIHTERIAEWVDRLASISPEELFGQEQAEGEETEENTAEGEKQTTSTSKTKASHSNRGRGRPKEGEGKRLSGITPSLSSRAIPTWTELNIGHLPMPIQTKGNIGKKRTSSNIGRSPRRMHRLLSDPSMRIFDKVSRGAGGVVIIDNSGSMSLSHKQVQRIVEHSPGALVASYSELGTDDPNMYILANKGRMVNSIPKQGAGNGVDFPAIEWAVKNKQRSNSPVVWVTDGGVCGKNAGYNDILAMQCINFCRKHNIIIVPHVEEAIAVLKKMKNGQKPESQYPEMFRYTWKETMGTEMAKNGSVIK